MNAKHRWLIPLIACFFGLSMPALLVAQDKDEEKDLTPRAVELETSDGVDLAVQYYPSDKGEEAVPVMILHGYKEDGNMYEDLALFLQQKGHAVIVPDLRAHGESTELKVNDDKTIDLKPEKIRAADMIKMVKYDVEAVKQFLIAENNKGALNIDKLCVIGSEMGAVIAMNWSVLDWSWPNLAIGKQGKDVKALVLLSPEYSSRGLGIERAFASNDVRQLSFLIVVGEEDSKSARYAERIYGKLKKYHPEPAAEDAAKLKSLFYKKKATTLKGVKLLGQAQLQVKPTIAAFIDVRLAKKKYPWKVRDLGIP